MIKVQKILRKKSTLTRRTPTKIMAKKESKHETLIGAEQLNLLNTHILAEQIDRIRRSLHRSINVDV